MLCALCAAERHDETVGNWAEHWASERTSEALVCARCGARLPASGAGIAGTVVESTAARGPISAELPFAALDLEPEAPDPGTSTGLMVARPSLPALLWRQPAVRAAARAGASAVALTVGMRLLRGWLGAWLARPRNAHAVATTALPLAQQLLHQPMTGLQRPAQRRGSGWGRGPQDSDEVVETFIYVRRVLRRR